MSDTFQNNRKTTRLQNWNYSWEGLYFITIKTKFGEHYFGEIIDNNIVLNDLGREVERQWFLTPSIRPDMNMFLDEFQIMPNHLHGIIAIGPNEYNSNMWSTKIRSAVNTAKRGGTMGPQRKTLGSILRGFKSSVTSWCKDNHVLFDWQSRFYDIIIRDEKVLEKIRNYIRNNPRKWQKDRFNKK